MGRRIKASTVGRDLVLGTLGFILAVVGIVLSYGPGMEGLFIFSLGYFMLLSGVVILATVHYRNNQREPNEGDCTALELFEPKEYNTLQRVAWDPSENELDLLERRRRLPHGCR